MTSYLQENICNVIGQLQGNNFPNCHMVIALILFYLINKLFTCINKS